MDIKTIVASLLVAILASVGIGAVVGHSGKSPVVQVGAATSPDISSPYFSYGGVRHWAAQTGLRAGTTTVCALQSPASTSTAQTIGVKIDNASSTATIWDVAKASTPFATTTLLGSAYSVGAGAQAFIRASTSPTAGDASVFAPNTYVVIGVRQAISAGDTAGTGFVPTGICEASWVEFPSL